MTDRDHFAAAALTGLLARRDCYDHELAILAYDMADAMLRERGNHPEKPDSSTNHDASPAARASLPTADHAVRRGCESGCGAGDISEAQIDALECVVEDGRIVGMGVYGHLRSLLVRLRPEWECESDRSKPISDERLAALEELSALDQELEREHGITGNPMVKARHNNEPI